MNAWFADTFFFIALMDDEDDAHPWAFEIVRTLSRRVLTTQWVLAEVGDAFASTRHRGQFHVLLETIAAHPMIEVVAASDASFAAGAALRRPPR